MVEKRECGGGSNDNDGCGRMAAIVVVECITALGVAQEGVRLSPAALKGTSKPRNPMSST
jgi:hypothetical protein